MKTIEAIIGALGRFALGVAIGLALTSAYVIATEAITAAEPSAGTIAVEESLRATAAEGETERDGPATAPDRLHVYGRGAQRV